MLLFTELWTEPNVLENAEIEAKAHWFWKELGINCKETQGNFLERWKYSISYWEYGLRGEHSCQYSSNLYKLYFY